MHNIKIIDNFLNKEDLYSLLNQLKNKKTTDFKILHNTMTQEIK